MTCADDGCQKRVDDMHNDFYKDKGVRDQAIAAVSNTKFIETVTNLATKKMFYVAIVLVFLVVCGNFLKLYLCVADCADQTDKKANKITVSSMASDIRVIKAQNTYMLETFKKYTRSNEKKSEKMEESIKANHDAIIRMEK